MKVGWLGAGFGNFGPYGWREIDRAPEIFTLMGIKKG
jgi:hypothetical protein